MILWRDFPIVWINIINIFIILDYSEFMKFEIRSYKSEESLRMIESATIAFLFVSDTFLQYILPYLF